jgi:hypothetical protein
VKPSIAAFSSGIAIRMLPAALAFGALTMQSITAQAIPASETVASLQRTEAAVSRDVWRARNATRFQRNWGVDIVGVRPISTGFMLTFRYRVVDPEKAKLLNDKRSKAYLIDEANGNTLSVPIMENLGEMRQKSEPELNRTYFIMFGNPGKLVKSGSRVSVVIGDFRADGLTVD